MISGSGTSLIWVIHGYLNGIDGWPIYLGGIEPLYPGLLASLIVFALVNFIHVRRMN
jgi:hypothetical protein